MMGGGGLVFDLHTQTTDVDVHDFFLSKKAFAPDMLEDIQTAERGAGVRKEKRLIKTKESAPAFPLSWQSSVRPFWPAH